jgi:branched-subunit amino acid transport protein
MVTIVGLTVATAVIRGAGPILIGGRALRPRVAAVIALLAPALLAALIVTETVGGDGSELRLDERLAGVAAGAASWLCVSPCWRRL